MMLGVDIDNEEEEEDKQRLKKMSEDELDDLRNLKEGV
jgi:hypothetical protein